MPKYSIELPNGEKYSIEAANEAELQATVAQLSGQQPSTTATPPSRSYIGMGYPSTPPMDVSKGITQGIMRGPEAFMEGAGALVDDVSVALAKVGGPEAARKAGERRDYNRAMTEEARRLSEISSPDSVIIGDITAGLVPMAPGSQLAQRASRVAGERELAVETLGKVLPRAMGQGIVASQTAYQKPEDRPVSLALGATLPMAQAALGKAPQAVWNNWARRTMMRQDTNTMALRQRAANAFVDPNTGEPLGGLDDYIAAQAAGDARLGRLTMSAADVRARDTINKQLDQRIENVRKVINSTGPGRDIVHDEQRARGVYAIIDRENRAMKVDRNRMYKDDMDLLAHSPEGRAVRVPLGPIEAAFRDVQREFGNPVALAKDMRLGRSIEDALQFLEDLPAGSSATVEGYRELSVGINSLLEHSGGLVQSDNQRTMNRIAHVLKKALNDTADSVPGNAPGMARFRAINQQYAQASEKITRFENDEIMRIFGDPKSFADPDTAFDRYISASPSAQREGIRLLNAREGGPELVAYMRRRYLDTVLRDATSESGPAMKSTLNANKLFNGLTSKEIQENPLFSPQQRAWAAGAAADLKVILNSLPDVGRVGTDITPADLTANIVGMNPVFVARLVARIVTGVGLENVLFTQEGRTALNTVRNLNRASDSAKQAATGYLVGLLARETQDHAPDQQQQGTQGQVEQEIWQ